MKGLLRSSGRLLFDYSIIMILFVVFIYPFTGIMKDNLGKGLPYYSFVFFLITFVLLYTEMKQLAIKEKKPQYDLHPYPFKGLVYGLISVIPIVVVSAALALFPTSSETARRLLHLAVNTLLGPGYFLIKIFHSSILGYALAVLVIPVMAMLGYLAGYYGIEIMKKLRKQPPVVEKQFKKSPWNPSNQSSAPAKKKKTK